MPSLVMCVKSPLWILLLVLVQRVALQELFDYYDDLDELPPLNCSTTETITGGHVTYSQGGLEGSVLTYDCGVGKYPSPVGHRTCGADGEWTVMRLASGRRVSRATCKDVLCPGQLQLELGDFWPRDQWFRVGTEQSFSCVEGVTLYGSAQRNCTVSGEWTGTTPVCDNHAGDCNDPGIPPGAQRTASRFHSGEKVVYQCQAGLDLLGSSVRVCLEDREWSGSTPRCQGPNVFDSPGVVAAAMAGSLAGLMDVVSPDAKKKDERSEARTLNMDEGSRMNVYILLDTSGSITKKEFDKSKEATVALIRKLDSYEVKLKFHVLSFASEARDIVDITDAAVSSRVEDVIYHLEEFEYNSHGSKTGTNLHAALHRVSELISFFRQNRARNHFNETQNVIIIETDGFANTGPNPNRALVQIRHLLGYGGTDAHDHTHETLLDVYVFGVGSRVKKAELNMLGSKKNNEQHVFILENYKTLGQVFNSIISDESVTMCGVAQEDEGEYRLAAYTKPWHVTMRSTEWGPKGSCVGSVVSQNWVLTAAHCFAKASTDNVYLQLDIEHGDGRVSSNSETRLIMHPKYNVSALRHRNISEFYDYDVALIYVNQSIPLSWKVRPICLPCTVPASRALRTLNATCQQHRNELLPHEDTAVYFIHKDSARKQTHVHPMGGRSACVQKAQHTLIGPTDVPLEEYVPDRFLCSGGTKGYQDAIACKGDSGGSLFLQKRKRYFQVAVVSWGTIDVCNLLDPGMRGFRRDTVPPNARDFHIDLFKIMPWLKQHLGDQIQFLPDVK